MSVDGRVSQILGSSTMIGTLFYGINIQKTFEFQEKIVCKSTLVILKRNKKTKKPTGN